MKSQFNKYSVFIGVIFAVLITANSQTTCQNTGLYFEEVENSCENYTRCLFGLRSEHTCDEGLQFDPNTSRCDLPSVVGCNKCPLNIQPGEFIAYHDIANCSIGFVCFGVPDPFQIDCQAHLHFDIDTLMCILTENSNCIPQIATTEIPSTTTTTPEPTTTTPEPTTTTPEPTTTTTRPTTTTTLRPTTTQAPGPGCAWTGCYHFSGAVCSTAATGGSNRPTYITYKKCEIIGRKDFCCDINCKYQECGKTCNQLKMRKYPEKGDVTCTLNIPNFGAVQSVAQYCCP